MNIRFLLVLFFASHALAQNPTFQRVKRANRRFDAKTTRATIASERAQQNMQHQRTNGDEQLYTDKRASFGKSLAQLDSGLISPAAFTQMVTAIENGDSDVFLTITMGTNPVERKLNDPQGAFSFNLDGADGWINVIPTAPTLTSAETAGEMVELYWHALLRDVPFNEYFADATAASAVDDLNKLTDFKGPKNDGLVTANTLFRGNTPGDLVGPFISQFLYLAVPYGPESNFDGGTSGTAGIDFQAQKVPTSSTINDFMTTFATWHAIQKGENPTATITFSGTRTFIRNARDMGDYVHQDSPMLTYENVARILLNFGDDALDPNNPYLNNPTQRQFINYGSADISYLLGIGSQVALRTAWYQKFVIHRRIRPEFFGFLVNQQKTGTQDFGINSQVLDSEALVRIKSSFLSYFLPQAYPEGSPTHPSYPAAHAVVAGCLTTILKAFFNESFVIPNPLEPAAGNLTLVPYATGPALTVGGELNKLASNIALGRNYAGVHYRSDGWQGILLGEKVALSILEDESYTRNIDFNGYSLTKFDGKIIKIGAKKTARKING